MCFRLHIFPSNMDSVSCAFFLIDKEVFVKHAKSLLGGPSNKQIGSHIESAAMTEG